MKKILLLDSHAVLHRSYHAMANMITTEGLHSGAVFGFIKSILLSEKIIKPDYIFACYDLPKPTFRHLAFDNYKGHRKEIDNQLVEQINNSKKICDTIGIQVLSEEGYEADDIIGSIAKQYGKKYKIYILTSDMDIMQLIKDNVKVLYLKSLNESKIIDREGVFEKYNLYPENIPDYKGLVGDTSDNIQGVAGIGEKTGLKIINEEANLEDLYKKLKKEKSKTELIEKLGEKLVNKLLENEEEAMFSKTLATIYTDCSVDLRLNEENAWRKNINEKDFQYYIDMYEMRSLRDIFNNTNINEDVKENKNNNIKTKSEDKINNTDTDILSNKIKMSIKNKIVIEETQEDIELLNEILIMSSLIYSERSKLTFLELLSLYKLPDSTTREELRAHLIEKLKSDNLYDYYEMFEKPSIEIIKKMKQSGILIDKNELQNQTKNIKVSIDKLEKDIHDLAGEEFLVSSPKQLAVILFDRLNLASENKKLIKKTKGGERSTNIEVLESIRDEHPIINKIIEWREISKIYNTYLLPLADYIEEDGRIHPQFVQTGAATGRWSCEHPNLQNLPVKSDIGKEVRNIFISSPGKSLLSLDYSQIDLRAACILSGDEKLLEIFNNGEDIHRGVAARILGKRLDEVTSEERYKAKAINFGILYGMGVSALKDAMGVSDRKVAQEFYDNYKNTFVGVMNYLESVKNFAKANGYTETAFGRRRDIPLIKSPLPFLRSQGERIAINAPIQGTSSDIIKLGAINIYNKYKKEIDNGEIKILLQIHDELVFEIDDDRIEKVAKDFEKILEKLLSNLVDDITDNDIDNKSQPIQKLYNKKDNIPPLLVSFNIAKRLGDVK